MVCVIVMYRLSELSVHSETNLKVRNVVPDIAMYLGDRLERISTFHGLVYFLILFCLLEVLCSLLLIN